MILGRSFFFDITMATEYQRKVGGLERKQSFESLQETIKVTKLWELSLTSSIELKESFKVTTQLTNQEMHSLWTKQDIKSIMGFVTIIATNGI